MEDFQIKTSLAMSSNVDVSEMAADVRDRAKVSHESSCMHA